MAEELGMDPSFFGSHSLRSGGATNLLINGVAREAINYYAGWNPDGNTMNLYATMTHHQPGALSEIQYPRGEPSRLELVARCFKVTKSCVES